MAEARVMLSHEALAECFRYTSYNNKVHIEHVSFKIYYRTFQKKRFAYIRYILGRINSRSLWP